MLTKAIEIRDRHTFIPVIATKMVPANDCQRYLLRRAGYGFEPPLILLTCIAGGKGEATCDLYDWGASNRTMQVAHEWLAEHFDEIEDGHVVDVEFILGETGKPKLSERFGEPA